MIKVSKSKFGLYTTDQNFEVRF